ncbi:MAG: hypothetical protein ACMXYF_03695 [Candidatus Woesearchaeota archaeon]
MSLRHKKGGIESFIPLLISILVFVLVFLVVFFFIATTSSSSLDTQRSQANFVDEYHKTFAIYSQVYLEHFFKDVHEDEFVDAVKGLVGESGCARITKYRFDEDNRWYHTRQMGNPKRINYETFSGNPCMYYEKVSLVGFSSEYYYQLRIGTLRGAR